MQDIIPPPKRPKKPTTSDDEANELIQQKIAEKKSENNQSQSTQSPVKPVAIGGVVKAPWWRRIPTGLLVLLCILSGLGLNISVWANRTLLNTPAFVDAFGPLSDNPKIQEKLTNEVTDRILSAASPQEIAAKLLPAASAGQTDEQLRVAIRPVVSDAVATALKSPQFSLAWRDALNTVHTTILSGARLEGSQPIEIKLTPILNEVLDSFKGGKLSFIADDLRQQVITSQAATIKPGDVDSIAKLHSAVHWIELSMKILAGSLLCGLLLVLAISPYRFKSIRKILLFLGIELLLIALIFAAGKSLTSRLAPADIRSVADSIVSQLFSGLILQSLVVGGVLVTLWGVLFILHRTKLSRVA